MSLDGIVLSKIVKDLKNKLPFKINKIQEISNSEYIFNLFSNNLKYNLLISTQADTNRVHFTNKIFSSINKSNFYLSLKKFLINGYIIDIIQKEFDRVIIFKIKNLNHLYDEVYYDLYVELIGKFSNIILVNNQTNTIIDANKKIFSIEDNKRNIQINLKFEELKREHKEDPFNSKDFDYNLKYQGFSNSLHQEIQKRIENGEKFNNIINEINDSNSLFFDTDFHIIPFGQKYKKLDLHYGFDYIYDEIASKNRNKILENKIFKLIKKEVKHFSNKVKNIQNDLNNSYNYDIYKNYGELLFMYENLMQKGLNYIQINDYNNNTIKIEIDPKLSVKENANKYFQKYHKLKRSIDFLNKELKLANDSYDYFSTLQEQISLNSYEDILDIKDELIRLNYLKNDKAKDKNKKNKKTPTIYKIHYNNKTIIYGKNNVQNNYISSKLSKDNYYFFHTKDYSGSHLMINDDKLNEDEIRLCAMIAAYFSKGRNSSSIPVDYCLYKDVKKINGSKVALKNQKTIYIDINLDLLNELKII